MCNFDQLGLEVIIYILISYVLVCIIYITYQKITYVRKTILLVPEGNKYWYGLNVHTNKYEKIPDYLLEMSYLDFDTKDLILDNVYQHWYENNACLYKDVVLRKNTKGVFKYK